MGAGKKKRAEWRNGFDTSSTGSIHALAVLAKTPDAGGNSDHKETRWKLIEKGKFNEALDKLVAADKVDDLTDAERAYCEGWAAYARQVFHHANMDDEDQFLVQAIQAAIVAHTSGGGGSLGPTAG